MIYHNNETLSTQLFHPKQSTQTNNTKTQQLAKIYLHRNQQRICQSKKNQRNQLGLLKQKKKKKQGYLKFGHFSWEDSSPSRQPGVLAVQEEFDARIFYANISICALLFLRLWYISSSQDYQGIILAILPGGKNPPKLNKELGCSLYKVILGAAITASRSLIEVDIGGLERLKYEYKGA